MAHQPTTAGSTSVAPIITQSGQTVTLEFKMEDVLRMLLQNQLSRNLASCHGCKGCSSVS